MLSHDLAYALDPVEFAVACGIDPDAWQSDLLSSVDRKVLLNCSRQSSKSTISALIGLHTAIYDAPALVLLVSPSQRQSSELFRKVAEFYRHLDGAPELIASTGLKLEFVNGSRIVALPGQESTIRGYSGAAAVIIDEAARVPDDLATAVRPMLATSANGRLIALSTPFGRRGWFHEAWANGSDWKKIRIDAEACPRISKAFLEDERRELGEWIFRQEYGCEFVDTAEQYFSSVVIESAVTNTVRPLWA